MRRRRLGGAEVDEVSTPMPQTTETDGIGFAFHRRATVVPPSRRRGSAFRKTCWRDDRRVVPFLRRSRACKTTHPTQKDRRPPGRRRFAPEVWVRCGEPTLPIRTTGDAQRANGAGAPFENDRQGWIAEPSHFCGAAAPIKQHAQLKKIVVRPGDGAARLKFGSAAASRPYQLERRGMPNA
jgi:hypothetical protein